MTLSKNGIALVIFALTYLGLDISETELMQFINAVGQIISFALLAWNQINRKETTGFIFKKW